MSRPSSTIHDNAHAQVIAESDDSDIMDEVVRALSIELKRARVESDRLRAEKDKLQRELDDARLRLSDVEDGREQKVKRDDRSLYEQARREIDKLVQEKDEQNAKHVKEMEDLVQKLTRRKEKCRNVKAALEESRNALTTLRSAAASAIAELSVDGVSTSRKRKREDDDEGHPETTEGGSEARESPQSANELLDLRQFMGVPEGEPLSGPSVDHFETFIGTHKHWSKLMSALTGFKMKLCAQDNIIWSHRSSKRCLFVFPAHSYSFSTQALELHDYESWMRPGETRELCWSMKKTHYYCGTFRCSNVVNLPIQDVAELGLTEKHSLLQNIVKRSKTYGVFDQLNTVLSKADLLRDLHLDGTLLVRCHALEYVDWNNRVSDMFARFGDHADAPAVKSKKKKKNGPSKKSKQQ